MSAHHVVRPFLVLALAASALTVVAAPSAQAADPGDQALARLEHDADRPLTVHSEADGDVTFVGVPARTEVDNPSVTPTTRAAAAGDAAITRYGAAFGTAQPGTTVERTGVQAAVTGAVVRYQQQVAGVPVLGGDIAISLRDDGELSSVLAHTTDETGVARPTVTEAEAADQARAAFVKAAGPGAGTQVASEGRWLLDPDLVGGSATAPSRTVWRFEVTRGAHERRMVLVDDRTGGVLLNADQIGSINRVVCNDNNTVRNENLSPPPCTGGFARSEGGAATGDAEVDGAYDLAAPVSDLYAVLGVDLTALIGRTVSGGGTALAQTVNFCPTSTPLPPTCPGYANAFWSGSQMYYGTGYAAADDVVGHEMTHGVTERTSGLFYWGQSGAMNESLSDILGEIVDHRHVTGGDSPTSWEMGEDLPGGAIRDLANPPAFGHPDKTSSSLYDREIATNSAATTYPDNDGVHSNSGVGNKTFHLISQGGTFNGQTITGIDVGDAGLTKSAALWLLVDQSLTSGSDWRDEATVLEQSCQALLATPASGFTAADCTAVHQGTLATELRTTPTLNPQPADAASTCPTGTRRALFASETGTPSAKFAAGPTWGRGSDIAHSGSSSWISVEPSGAGASSLTMSSGITVPTGQKTYLFFQRWQVLDYVGTSFYDALTVEVDDLGTAAGPADVAGLPWVNGPSNTIFSGSGNPAGGRKGFGGDSRGYLASRLDLSSLAGKAIKARFTMTTDSSVSLVGLALDDVEIYTCDVPKIVARTPVIRGIARVAQRLRAVPGTWQPAGVTLRYRWLRNGNPIAKATNRTYVLKRLDRGRRVSVKVTGSKAGYTTKSAISKRTPVVKPRA